MYSVYRSHSVIESKNRDYNKPKYLFALNETQNKHFVSQHTVHDNDWCRYYVEAIEVLEVATVDILLEFLLIAAFVGLFPTSLFLPCYCSLN